MSIEWKFNSNEVEEKSFEPIKPGKYLVRVKEFEPTKSKSGLDMIKMVFDVSGCNNLLYEYLVFNPTQSVITNTKIKQISDSFTITPGDFNPVSWIGKIGAVCTKIDDQNYAKISYFVPKFKQSELPAWIEPGNKKSAPSPDIFVDNSSDIPY